MKSRLFKQLVLVTELSVFAAGGPGRTGLRNPRARIA